MFYCCSSTLFTTVCFVALLVCVYKYLTKNFNYWKNKGVCYQEPWPVFGNYARFFFAQCSIGDVYQSLYEKYSDVKYVGVYKSSKLDLMIRDPELMKQVLIKDFQFFHDRDAESNEITEPLNANLFSVTGDRWRIMRQKFTPIFTSSKLKKMFYLIVEKGIEFQNTFAALTKAELEELEVRDLFANFTTDVIGSCAFGVTMNSMNDKNDQFRKMGKKVFETSLKKQLKFIVYLLLPSIFNFFKMRITDIEVEEFFLNTVKDIVQKRQFSTTKRHDYIDLMIELKESNAKEDNPIEFTDMFLTAQAFVFFIAGFESSSTLMSFTLHELAFYPEIQQKLQEEIDSVIEKYDGGITYEGILEMKYLEMVICETQRKYPALSILTRSCKSSYTFPGTDLTIDKGVSVTIPVNAIHYNPSYYPDPERFIPERFTPEEIKSRHSMSYLPFGEGPRSCIGMRFGKMQTAVGLVSFLQKFSVEPSKKSTQKLELDPRAFVTNTKSGIWLKVNKREE